MKINREYVEKNINRDIRLKGQRKIEYLVIHYVGAESSARNNAIYFSRNYVGASAHYFVDETDTIYQSVWDKNVAWSVGNSTYKHPKARNHNTLNIEMCVKKKNGKWYFEPKTIENTIWLAKRLVKKYKIPKNNLIRHYDVTGKNCPAPFVSDTKAWNNFKDKVYYVAPAPKNTFKKIKDNFIFNKNSSLVEIKTGKKIQAFKKGDKLFIEDLVDNKFYRTKYSSDNKILNGFKKEDLTLEKEIIMINELKAEIESLKKQNTALKATEQALRKEIALDKESIVFKFKVAKNGKYRLALNKNEIILIKKN